MNRALRNLSETLAIAHDLVKKFTNKVVNTLKYKSDFNYVNERLSETYHILSRALQVKQENAMLRMFQDFGLDDDDDDDDDYAVHAVVGVEKKTLYYSESLYFSQ